MISAEKLDIFLGKKIREKRESISENKLTQAGLADLVGLSRASIANIEGGKQSVSLYHLYVISEALKLNINDLLPQLNEINVTEEDVKLNFGNQLHSISKRDADILNLFLKGKSK